MKIIAALLLASIPMTAIAQPAPPPAGPPEYTIRLPTDDVNWIGRALDELPAKIANPIVKRIVDQITVQNKAFEETQKPKPADANANPAEPPK